MPIIGVIDSGKSGHLTPPSSFESIATSNPTSGLSVTFSSIPSTYKHLQLRALIRNGAGGSGTARYLLQFNGDATTSNYYSHALTGDGTSATAYGVSGQAGVFVADGVIAGGSAGNVFGVSVVDILDYTNTNKNRTVRTLAGGNLNGSGTITLQSGLYMDTTAITSLTVNLANTSFQSGTQIALYGIKG